LFFRSFNEVTSFGDTLQNSNIAKSNANNPIANKVPADIPSPVLSVPKVIT